MMRAKKTERLRDPDEDELDRKHPDFPWRRPQVEMLRGTNRFICRYCTAMYGLLHTTVEDLPRTEAEFLYHMVTCHDRLPEGLESLVKGATNLRNVQKSHRRKKLAKVATR